MPIPKHPKSTLLLIGNGFDVAAGYATRYEDFFNSTYFTNIKKNNIAKYLVAKKERNKYWSDLENTLYEYSKENIDYNQEEFQKELQIIKCQLYQYLLVESQREVKQNTDFITLVKLLIQNPQLQIGTFNYTTIIDDLITQLNNQKFAPHIKITHFHGKLETSTNSPQIVIGIDSVMKVEPNHDFLFKKYDPIIERTEYGDWVKKKDKIIIFGCSMGKSDQYYFEQIFQNCTDKIFEIYHFKDTGLREIQRRIEELSLNKYDDFITYNDVQYHDTLSIKTIIEQKKENT